MAKILLVIVVFAAVFFIVRTYARAVATRRDAEQTPGKTEDMVRCAHCGVHLPRSDSVTGGDRSFCSKEHQRLHGPGG